MARGERSELVGGGGAEHGRMVRGSFVAPERNGDSLGRKNSWEQQQGGQFRGGGCFTAIMLSCLRTGVPFFRPFPNPHLHFNRANLATL